jgi:hypothetical protein
VIAYPFYILPVLLPAKRWLGIAPVLFGMSQALGHGIIFPRIAGARYSPGFFASILLHVPLGIAYFKALGAEGRISKTDLALAIAYTRPPLRPSVSRVPTSSAATETAATRSDLISSARCGVHRRVRLRSSVGAAFELTEGFTWRLM